MSWWKIWQRGAERREAPVPEILPPLQPSPPRCPVADPEPATSQGPGGAPVTGRPKVFDPALKHFRAGLLPDEPPFQTADEVASWRALQRHVMGHVLGSLADSPAASRLVLRGSALLCAWFPETARPPKDLDFVVVPETLSISDRRAGELLESVVAAVTSRECAGVELRRDEVAQDQIWTYDRVPGTRLVFRWTAPGLPWGATQLDFVFGERLPVAHQMLDVALTPERHAVLQVAPKDLSLAWKLLWLHSDMHPRGKDLYDANRNAGRCSEPAGLRSSSLPLATPGSPHHDLDQSPLQCKMHCMAQRADAQLTFRLPKTIAGDLSRIAARRGLRRSDLLRQVVEQMVAEEAKASSHFERVKDLIGAASTGQPDLGSEHRRHLKNGFGRDR